MSGLSWSGRCSISATTRAYYSMKIYTMRILTVGCIFQSKVYKVSLPYTDELAGYGTTKCPESILSAISDLHYFFYSLQLYDYFFGGGIGQRFRHVRCMS